MAIVQSLVVGTRAANKSFRMILLLYGVNLLVAVLLALTFRSILVSSLGSSMALEKILQDFDFTVYNDFVVKHGQELYVVFSQVIWFVFFYMIVNIFLDGGLIYTLNSQVRSFSLKSFLEGCGTYFFRFVRLFALFMIALAIVAFVTFLIISSLYNAMIADAVSEVIPVFLFILLSIVFFIPIMIVVMIGDYAKVATIVDNHLSMVKIARLALRFVIRNLVKTVGLQISILLVLAGIIVLYIVIETRIGMASPIAIVSMFLIQQVSVGGKLWTRVLTFASELELFRGIREAPKKEVATEVKAPVPVEPSEIPLPILPPAEVAEKSKRRRRQLKKKSSSARARAIRKSGK
ncbi:MAG: hypothetical protein AABZ61_12910 [Bacteroidota bacterium]